MLRKLARTALVALLAVATAGCSSGTTGTTPAGGTSSSSVAARPTSSPTPPAPTLDAKGVLDALKTAGLPLSNEAVQDENTDPNNLIGRPNGYLSRASFDLPGGDQDAEKYGLDRGGVIEVFPDTASAAARSKFIQDTLKSIQILGTTSTGRSSCASPAR